MHSKEKIMNEQQKFEKRKQRTKIILITISALFMIVMLVLPLFSVITNSLSEGFKFYVSSISTEYVRSALFVTILATLVAVTINTFFGIMAAFLLTKFSFKGKQVLATLIDIPFSISPVIVGLAFLMTFGRLGWTYPAIRAINTFFGTNIRIAFAIPGVILATIVGIPMYADIFGTIPVAEALLAKRALLGTVLAFMMAVTTLSLPSLIMLKKAVKPKLLALFITICTLGIIIVGYAFNAFQYLLI